MTKTEKFIQKALNKHGDKYDYSKVEYSKYGDKVTIVCPVHGEFRQLPSKHIYGQGCPECAKIKISNSRSDTKETFIQKALKVHTNNYTYDKVNYIDSKTKVTITCPAHGDFEQVPSGHLQGKGCPLCRYIKTAIKNTKTTEQFVQESKLIHKNKYDYSKVIYIDSKTKVIIICPEHGEFLQSPMDHIRGKGCKKCVNLYTPTTEEFIERVNKIHNNKYDYSKVNYTNMHNLITIICPIHGEFEQTPRNHLKSNTGCPSCSLNGFDKLKPAILYYLKITTEDNQVLYKIGITNRTVQERFNLIDLKKIEIIKQKIYTNGEDAYNKEQEILKKFSQYKYKGPNILQCGNTELFIIDIRNLIRG